jgi:hypothetical protein
MLKAFKTPFPNIQIRKTTICETEKLIKSLENSRTCGYDEISNKILKACIPFISTPLCYLCNKVLFTGTFPDRLKYATI